MTRRLRKLKVLRVSFAKSMTISSTWVEVMKSECAEAFTAGAPFRAKCAYVDGMPSLMAAGTTRRWDDLVRNNFGRLVQRYFREGVSTVVLAFDDHEHVPLAKAITQANRSKKVAQFDFHERQALETVMPMDYNDRLRNRNYKRAVIFMITDTIVEHVPLRAGQHLVIDFAGCPVHYSFDSSNNKISHEYMTDVAPNGECDIKFTRWARCFGDMIAHSVDGDFLLISLMEHERQLHELQAVPARIAVYRMEYNMDKTPASGKRKKDDNADVQQAKIAKDAKGRLVTTQTGTTASTQSKPRRTYEYVNIPLLYRVISDAMRQCSPSEISTGAYREQYMRIFACLVGLTGTDFSRGLPHLGPKKVWEMLSDKQVWPGLMRSYNLHTKQLVPGDMCDYFIAHLYRDKFSKHAQGETLADVLDSLQRSKLAERTKSQLPSLARCDVTCRNVNW